VGGGRAEAYLRLLGEGGLRRAGYRLRDLVAVAGQDHLFRPGRTPARIAEDALLKVRPAGRILVAVGAVDEDFLVRVASDAREIEHRNIKPGNVLVTEDGTLELADFGIAKIRSKVEVTGQTVRAERRQPGRRADRLRSGRVVRRSRCQRQARGAAGTG
jgi:hypothetical protein